MTTKQKLIEIKRLLPAYKIAEIMRVSTDTVESWTRKCSNKPSKKNAKKINDLYEELKPCFERLKNMGGGKYERF